MPRPESKASVGLCRSGPIHKGAVIWLVHFHDLRIFILVKGWNVDESLVRYWWLEIDSISSLANEETK